MHSKRCKVPEPFQHPPFFKEDDCFNLYENLTIAEILKLEPFYFDMLYQIQGSLKETPWDNCQEYVPIIIQNWKKTKVEIQEDYKNRNISESTKARVIHCLSLFIVSLYWTNHKAVNGLNVKKELIEFSIKPVNCDERLLFIMNKPFQFHSFIQLDQLFTELEKLYYKSQAIQKR